MSTFRFRLTTLLKLRERVRDDRRTHLAEALRAQDILIERQTQLAAERDAAANERRHVSRPGVVHVDRLVETHRHDLLLREQMQGLERQAEMLQTEIEKRRAALVAADRDVRVLEKLRQRQSERHIALEATADMKRLDEVAARQASRQEDQAWAE